MNNDTQIKNKIVMIDKDRIQPSYAEYKNAFYYINDDKELNEIKQDFLSYHNNLLQLVDDMENKAIETNDHESKVFVYKYRDLKRDLTLKNLDKIVERNDRWAYLYEYFIMVKRQYDSSMGIAMCNCSSEFVSIVREFLTKLNQFVNMINEISDLINKLAKERMISHI